MVGVNEDRTVDIDFVDFGNKEETHFSGLMKIPETFTRLPVQVDGSNAVSKMFC